MLISTYAMGSIAFRCGQTAVTIELRHVYPQRSSASSTQRLQSD